MDISCYDCGSKDIWYDVDQELFGCMRCGITFNANGWMSVLPRIEKILTEENAIIHDIEEKISVSYVPVWTHHGEVMEPEDARLPKLKSMYNELEELHRVLKQIEKRTEEVKQIGEKLDRERAQKKARMNAKNIGLKGKQK